ncbi:PfkB family carbohydrate kinase [Pyxidicoccus xibeiensis]|uniref:PfkB family carbohydrate kinase n=1 Tax=Pyxidicoccus xibeiensis TaxID=2906759 RepID=UPI0020A75308|nr:PfkB family carbohydrate kinase [Pyxidicoccus xibeiensis]MCP3136075.1 PfkB family carbohydrate kinase [Pyxidicoccus xibeiensis]
MSLRPSRDVLVVGNYCHDLLRLGPGRQTHALGGSSAYISAVLDAVAVDYTVAAVAGEDFRYAGQVRHPPRVVPGTRTTQFTADWDTGERVLRVSARAEPIRPEDITVDARVALACGVMGELLPETLVRVSERARHVVADAQGLLRTLDGEGRVLHVRLSETPYAALLGRIHVLKASEDEARAMDVERVRQQTCLVITRGHAGCTVLTSAARLDVPAFPADEVDPTGAGDCFLAGFALGLLRELPLARCAELANWFGAQAVMQVGVPKVDVAALPAALR